MEDKICDPRRLLWELPHLTQDSGYKCSILLTSNHQSITLFCLVLNLTSKSELWEHIIIVVEKYRQIPCIHEMNH